MSFPERDVYFFRQRALALSPTYDVMDEAGDPVLHVVRPVQYGRTFLALGAWLLTLGYFAWLAWIAYDELRLAPFVLLPAGFVAAGVARLLVEPYRHVYLYADASREVLHEAIVQERKLVIITAPYTLVDGEGAVVATFSKNYLWNLIRRRWVVLGPDGAPLCLAWEDHILKAIARRIVGPLYGLLRTNFVITRDGARLGEFNRQLTIFDRYVLDLRRDLDRTLDRRIAVALGILLDTGEGR
ncbi:MAG: hypothetical protein U0166_03815 [Acidobacteriota bacterium]